MEILSACKGQATTGLQIIGAVSFVGGGVTALARTILGQDPTYPCTVMALGAWTLLTLAIGSCNQEKPSESSSDKDSFDLKALDKAVDKLGENGKKTLKTGTHSLVDLGVSAGKAAAVALSPPISLAVGSALDSAGTSAKSISDKSIDFSVDGTGASIKKSAHKSASSQ